MMDYCRWSSDKYTSDIYLYESNEVWTIQIADMRVTEIKDEIVRLKPLGLPLAGHTFYHNKRETCLARLLKLREMGYYVPSCAIERLDSEIDSQDSNSVSSNL